MIPYRTFALSAAAFAVIGLHAAGCTDASPNTLKPPSASDGDGSIIGGGKGNFPHSPDLGSKRSRDPLDVLAERAEEGAPEVRARLHSCQKLQIEALKSLLAGLGVSLEPPAPEDPSGPLSAASILAAGRGALGAADYDARVGERITWTTAGATKLFDIFIQAAPQIIANLPAAPLCQGGGANLSLFSVKGACNRDAVTCLIGFPPSEDHLIACESLVTSASTIERGQQIAVAALLSAAYSCE